MVNKFAVYRILKRPCFPSVSPYCGVSDDGDAYVTVTTDLHAEAKAICSHGEVAFTEIDKATLRLDVSYPLSSSFECAFLVNLSASSPSDGSLVFFVVRSLHLYLTSCHPCHLIQISCLTHAFTFLVVSGNNLLKSPSPLFLSRSGLKPSSEISICYEALH